MTKRRKVELSNDVAILNEEIAELLGKINILEGKLRAYNEVLYITPHRLFMTNSGVEIIIPEQIGPMLEEFGIIYSELEKLRTAIQREYNPEVFSFLGSCIVAISTIINRPCRFTFCSNRAELGKTRCVDHKI